MSICTCSQCGQFIDSDFDPGCFVEKPNYTNTANPVNPTFEEKTEIIVLCESCRTEVELPDEPVNKAGIDMQFDTDYALAMGRSLFGGMKL